MGGLSVKLSASSIQGGEYIKNATRGTTDGENDLIMMSIDALFAPTDNFDFRIIYDRIDDKTPTRPVVSMTTAGEAFGGFGLELLENWTALYDAPSSSTPLRTDAYDHQLAVQ